MDNLILVKKGSHEYLEYVSRYIVLKEIEQEDKKYIAASIDTGQIITNAMSCRNADRSIIKADRDHIKFCLSNGFHPFNHPFDVPDSMIYEEYFDKADMSKNDTHRIM